MKKYCVKPFNAIRLVNNVNGVYQYQPCCHYRHAGKFGSVDEYLNSAALATLQNHFLTKNHLPSGCEHCENYEAEGHDSTRLLANRMNAPVTETKITEIEIFPSNSCNLSCVMCQPRYSTGVGLEYKKLGWVEKVIAVDNKSEILKDLVQLPHLDKLTIIGGEFFLAKSCLDIIDFAIERKLLMSFVTNATVINEKHLEKLKLVSKLDITISIDGLDSEYEFIRYPAKWSTVESNIDLLRQQLPHAKVHVNAVAQLLNIQSVDKLIDWCNRRLLPMTLVPLSGAEWLGWQVLTMEEKQMVANQITQMVATGKLTKQQKSALLQFANNIKQSAFDPVLRNECTSKLATLAKLRHLAIPSKTKELMHL